MAGGLLTAIKDCVGQVEIVALSMQGPPGPVATTYSGESAWPQSGGGVFDATGGLTPIPIPTYQSANLGTTIANGFSGTYRNVPDVSADAVNFLIVVQGGLVEAAGTSGAAPLWAAFSALANQKGAQAGLQPLGFMNPVLYDIYGLPPVSASLYSNVFNDPTSGFTGFSATPGYDLATGLGTPTCSLLSQLASAAPLLPVGTAGIPSSGSVPISAYNAYACAIVDGALECWGDHGITGTSDAGACVEGLPAGTIPVSVAAGQGHTCALLSDGATPPSEQIWCWGENDYGQLGTGSQTNSTAPVQVTAFANPIALGVGGTFSCALSSTGRVGCWGNNTEGQIGVAIVANCAAGVDCQMSPTTVPLPLAAQALAVGDTFACALLTDGSVECWGDDSVGQLGVSLASGTFTFTPQVVTGVFGVTSIAAGSDYACVQVAAGGVSCWGDGASAQLGNYATSGGASVQAAPGLSLAGGVSYLAPGIGHTCAIDASSSDLYCLGDNLFYDCGGGAQPQLGPEYVSLPEPVVAVATGGDAFTCALVSNGGSPATHAVWCWGQGSSGQLGNGSAIASQGTPVEVSLAHCP